MSEAGAHANNERIWIENVPFALEMLYDIVARFCLRG
jgi:acetylornithine deacetylase/succinyl-diaminopimelate desuccinylase-like protein